MLNIFDVSRIKKLTYYSVNALIINSKSKLLDSLYKNTILNNKFNFKHINTYMNKLVETDVYNLNNNTDKHIFILSGGMYSTLHGYLNKTLFDLNNKYPDITKNYNIHCFVNKNIPKCFMDNTIVQYIKNVLFLNSDNTKEIILIGFSAGGVVMSHVLSNIKDIVCIKKLITYDTPHDIYNIHKYHLTPNLKIVEYYLSVIEIIENPTYNHTFDDVVIKLKEMTNNTMTETDIIKIGKFNYDFGDNVSYCNIFENYDPIVESKYVRHYINKNNESLKNYYVENICKNNLDHCTDMLHNDNYIHDIARMINK